VQKAIPANNRRDHVKPLKRLGDVIDRRLDVLFLLPGMLILAATLSYPILSNLWNSFTNAHLIYPGADWIGLENYLLTFRDPAFYRALGNSLNWTFWSILLQVVLGLAAALLLNARVPGQFFFRLAMIVPYAFPTITIALVWRWMLNSVYGVFNFMLLGLGIIERPIAWLSSQQYSLPVSILVNVWFGYPLFALGLLAGLQSIPAEHYEVARIEGASALQTLRHVILPGLKKILGILIVLRTIWVFNSFDLIYLLTGGGPRGATETLPIYAYRIGWEIGFISQTSAIAVLLFIVLLAFAFVYFRLSGADRED
jgi:multiple sugar transport system permease protein